MSKPRAAFVCTHNSCRSEGVVTAAHTFITKLATAIAGSAPLYIVQAVGFVLDRPNIASAKSKEKAL